MKFPYFTPEIIKAMTSKERDEYCERYSAYIRDDVAIILEDNEYSLVTTAKCIAYRKNLNQIVSIFERKRSEVVHKV